MDKNKESAVKEGVHCFPCIISVTITIHLIYHLASTYNPESDSTSSLSPYTSVLKSLFLPHSKYFYLLIKIYKYKYYYFTDTNVSQVWFLLF